MAHGELTFLRQLEKAYFARQYGVLGDIEWSRLENSDCNNYDSATSLGFVLPGLPKLTPEFVTSMVDRCAGGVE
jgi:hypothetical protein